MRQTETRKKTEIETAPSLFTLSLSVPHCVFLLYLRNKFSKGFFKRKSLAQGSKACHNHLYPAGDDVGIFRTFERLGEANPSEFEQGFIVLGIRTANRKETVLGRSGIIEMQQISLDLFLL